jgi:hypothetical protein
MTTINFAAQGLQGPPKFVQAGATEQRLCGTAACINRLLRRRILQRECANEVFFSVNFNEKVVCYVTQLKS